MAGPVRLSVTNQKGGVGKTTVAINLAGALNELGQDVLFVDLDPQGNATEGLGFLEAYDAQPPSLLDALLDPTRATATDLVHSHEEMDVVVSNVDMNVAESSLHALADGDTRLDTLLERLEPGYDVVVVDCPPYLGLLTDNALIAAHDLVIPALTEPTSKRSLELLFDYVASLELAHDIEIVSRALVANRIEGTREAAEMLEWFEAAVPDVPMYRVRKRVALQRAFAEGRSVFAAEAGTDMGEVFETMAGELLERLARTEVPA